MPTHDIRRLLDLISFLQRHENTTAEDIAKLLGCSLNDVQSMLDRILMCGTPPYSPRDYVCVFHEAGRIRVQFADHFRRPVNFSPAELACLTVLLDDPLVGESPQAREVRARIKRKLAGATATRGDEPEPSIAIARPGGHAQRIASALQQAIAAERRVRLLHFSSSRFAQVVRDVDPHRLLRIGDQLYLVGHDRSHRGRILQFRVDRIADVEPLDEPAERPDPAELDAALDRRIESDHSAGKSAAPERSILVLRVESSLLPHLTELLGPSAVREQADGSAVVRMPLVNENWGLRFVLSFGDEAKILEPAHLREKLATLVDEMLAQFDDQPPAQAASA